MGSVVSAADPSASNIRELCNIRVAFETRVLGLAIPNMDSRTFTLAAHILARIEGEQAVSSWLEGTLAFYCALYEPANRPRLQLFVKQLHVLTNRSLLPTVHTNAYRAAWHKKHRALLAACRAYDYEMADLLLRRHIMEVAGLFETCNRVAQC